MSTVDIKGEKKVWITDTSYTSPRDIRLALEQGNQERALNLVHVTNSDMSGVDGWMEVGMASISITLLPEEEMIEQLADGLRKQITATRAEAQLKITRIEEKLSQLLALPNPERTTGETL